MKTSKCIRRSDLAALKKAWLFKARDYKHGTRWTCNDPDSKHIRNIKADTLSYCAADIQYLLDNS